MDAVRNPYTVTKEFSKDGKRVTSHINCQIPLPGTSAEFNTCISYNRYFDRFIKGGETPK